jgi:tRNA 2-selenouridine synthase
MNLSIDEFLGRWNSFDEVIDVRSPDEWSLDCIPGATNSPVLSNDERVRVGSLYAASAFDAKKIGASLIARNIAIALETQFHDRSRQWRPLIYCWRGGNRSNAMATVLSRIGWKVSLLTGGYSAFRRKVVSELEMLCEPFSFRVICGVTGSGKSRFLRQLAARGQQVLDLEALAHHRGSLLGTEPIGTQPSQKRFETLLWHALRNFDANQPVYVESESRKIGSVQLTGGLINKMRASPCIELVAPVDQRVQFLCEEYAHFFNQPDHLIAQLTRLKPLVGTERLGHWCRLIEEQKWAELVERLLVDHYDPTYSRSMQKNYAGYAQAQRVSDLATFSG